MKLLSIIFILAITASCAVVPAYQATRVDYCERVNGIIYCNDVRIDTNHYDRCSVYDDRSCEDY